MYLLLLRDVEGDLVIGLFSTLEKSKEAEESWMKENSRCFYPKQMSFSHCEIQLDKEFKE